MRFLKKLLPTHQSVKNQIRWRWLAKWLGDPRLWHFNRHTIALGTAAGLFVAVIPLPLQMLLAALLAIVVRGNIPIAVVMTWVTNPFTMIPVVWLIYTVGSWITGEKSAISHFKEFHIDWAHWTDIWPLFHSWLMALGKNFFVGLPLVAVGLAVLGYVLIQLLWRCYVYVQIYLRRRRYAR